MQYGVEVLPYKREGKKNVSKGKNNEGVRAGLKYIVLFSVMLLVTRVKLINNMAPFGVAMLMCITSYTSSVSSIVVTMGGVLGYLSLIGQSEYLGLYIIALATTLAFQYIVGRHLEKKKRIFILGTAIFLEFLLSNFLISGYGLQVSAFSALLQITLIVPICFVLDNGIMGIKELNTKHLFNNEEIISMGILLSLIVAGTWGIEIAGISLMNIFALASIAIVSYICGSSVGAATGVAMGIVAGMCTNNMVAYISMYSICGLITGIFKDVSKWVSAIGFIVVFLILKIYLLEVGGFSLIEAGVASLIFVCISNKHYRKLALDLNADKKTVNLTDEYVDKVKEMFAYRLEDFSGLLTNMSGVLNNLIENDKLGMRNKSSALVQCLADRVCSNCDMNHLCWKREIHYTYSAFGELIQNLQENNHIVPNEIERKCTHRNALLRNAEDIITKYMLSEMKRLSLCEGRELLSNQIINISGIIKNIGEDFSKDITINTKVEQDIRRILDKSNINYEDVFSFENKGGSLVVKVSIKNCRNKDIVIKAILPLICKATGIDMCISNDKCNVDYSKNIYEFTFEQAPKFYVSTYASVKCKEGEKCNGDTFNYGGLNDGSYLCVLSDGMGSGPQASRESSAAVQLVNDFMKSGFDKVTAINVVNSIMTMRFDEEEKFTTLDLANIDLNTGEAEFVKVGSVSTFIKSANNISIVRSKSLPIGVLEEADIEIERKMLKNGDFLIMMSDGVSDCDQNEEGDKWISEYLKNNNFNDPKDLAYALMDEAMKLSKYKIKDDMTVLVSKVYALE